MTDAFAEGIGLGETLRLTWVADHLVHVLEHREARFVSGLCASWLRRLHVGSPAMNRDDDFPLA